MLLADGTARVKEGALSAGWNDLGSQITQVALAGDRIAVLSAGGALRLSQGPMEQSSFVDGPDHVVQVVMDSGVIS